MTVALPLFRSDTVSNGSTRVKQLERRRLPVRARPTHRKRDVVAALVKKCQASRLRKLRCSYARRGVSLSPPPPVVVDQVIEVSNVSLAGAKRSYVELDAPSDYDYFSDSSSDTSSTVGFSLRRVKYVQFASHSSVVEVPHFSVYAPDQKGAMWNGCKNIRTMARRNTIEYQHDGWSVETAAEEDEFVEVKGIMVHPAHVSVAARKKHLKAE